MEAGLSNRPALTVDEALAKVGEFGWAQVLQLLLVSTAWVAGAAQTFASVFASLDPIKARAVQCVQSDDADCRDALAAKRPNVCSLPRDAWRWHHPGWSVVSEFELACSGRWAVPSADLLFFLGAALGCAAAQLSSKRGTSWRRLLYSACLASAAAGLLAATAPSLWVYALCRGLTGVSVGVMGLAAYVLATDPVGPSWRGTASLVLQLAFAAGACGAASLGWLLPGWRALVACCALSPLGCVATWSAVVESPRWLLVRGRKGEATAALAALALGNRSRPPDLPLADLAPLLAGAQRRLADLLRHPRLRKRLVVAGYCWLAVHLAYYGLALLADALSSPGDARGDGSPYVTALTGFSYEFPGVAAAGLGVEKIGRRATLLVALLQAGGSLVAAAVLRGAAQRTLAVAARFGLAAAAAALFVATPELFPALLSNQGMLVAAYLARAGAALAPGMAAASLALHGALAVPLFVAGGACLAGAALAPLLPETLGAPACDTIQDFDATSPEAGRRWPGSLRQVLRGRGRKAAAPLALL